MHAEQRDAVGRVVFRFRMHRVPFLPRADVLHLAGGALHHAEEIKRDLSGPVLLHQKTQAGGLKFPSLRNQLR